ncbi:MAG: hypothetical protein BWX68_02970 [Verrucomicrobia bacterium ADurb.Bin063]|nr:MAG: hypothetical protein BWX68_02970 [Verrucomicrobia bacterium ADurb.Bin063]
MRAVAPHIQRRPLSEMEPTAHGGGEEERLRLQATIKGEGNAAPMDEYFYGVTAHGLRKCAKGHRIQHGNPGRKSAGAQKGVQQESGMAIEKGGVRPQDF